MQFILELQGCQSLAHACFVSMLGHELCPVALDVLFLCDQYIDRRDCDVTYSMLRDVRGTSTAVSGAKGHQCKP